MIRMDKNATIVSCWITGLPWKTIVNWMAFVRTKYRWNWIWISTIPCISSSSISGCEEKSTSPPRPRCPAASPTMHSRNEFGFASPTMKTPGFFLVSWERSIVAPTNSAQSHHRFRVTCGLFLWWNSAAPWRVIIAAVEIFVILSVYGTSECQWWISCKSFLLPLANIPPRWPSTRPICWTNDGIHPFRMCAMPKSRSVGKRRSFITLYNGPEPPSRSWTWLNKS